MNFDKNKLQNDLSDLKIEKRSFINNQFVASHNKETFSKKSPIDNSDIIGITHCYQEDVELAIKYAEETFKGRTWVEYPLENKKKLFLNLAAKMQENIYELALLDTYETGRSFRNYYEDSIPKAIEIVTWFAEAIDKISDEATAANQNNLAFIHRVPIGVVACITPWNDPLVPALWKMIPALLMGNSVIMKPAEQSTFSLLKIAQFLKELGLPAGALAILTGPGETTGKFLAKHPKIRGVFFTGSSEVGQKILEYCGQSGIKKIGLECGGKSTFIISKKSNKIELAAKTLAQNIFYNQGQICSAPSRAFVHKDQASDFLKYLLKFSKDFTPKHSLDYSASVSTLISSEAKVRVEKLLKLADGKCENLYIIDNDVKILNALSPTIIYNLDVNSELNDIEIFGPILILNSYDDINEVVLNSNQSQYGLAASIWSDNLDEAIQISQRLEAGIVHINSYGSDDMRVPFGGFKQSGVGKDKSLHAFDEYSQLKTTWINF